ncbi:ESX-1 secretion-associated protein [Candidatus Mycolicibacterium alkanivorans]|uniref:ESX-1 secretion-associated protein n=1 Tax=Candidatus Mycolicibacterium alkanivorans TaxID=2954114 RepID=A0ABS9YRV9_9MYCO|nr:ESX-1 secretion-associated protein [Candidatus Mycolicibacterium alkanivorans]MCI4673961.1 ESX-1 secretion-associated protein [Candidatus Mycolicibacterium alkanivorans]
MAERIHVVPDELREAARHHRETAEQLRTVPSNHHDIMASLESLGPIFCELREAGRELLDQRRTCYEQQAEAHDELAADLRHAADTWEQQDSDAAAQLGRVVEGGP